MSNYVNVMFENCKRYADGRFVSVDAMQHSFLTMTSDAATPSQQNDAVGISISNCYMFPAFCDVHVHLREPGFFYKESIATGTAAAARGGYADVFSMANLNPVPDTVEHIEMQWEIIRRDAKVRVHPYAAITKGLAGGELVDFQALAPVCGGFSDDGKGVQSDEMMEAAMRAAKSVGKIIVAHCEDERLLHGGCIHGGDFAAAHGLPGICSESEWGQIARDLKLAEKTGCAYHVCHISTKESVAVIREAKARGVDVTCETAPHYLTMDDSMIEDHGRFKMNPPIRAKEDREALLAGLLDGTIDMIATDHAPHSDEEKAMGLRDSRMGVVGLETAFSVLYTKLVKPGILPLEKLVEVMAINPRKRFGLPLKEDDLCVFDLNAEYVVDPSQFATKGRSTPFDGWRLQGVCRMTVVDGKMVYNN
jgi:dihydroorotase